jgi:hypothetical protein
MWEWQRSLKPDSVRVREGKPSVATKIRSISLGANNMQDNCTLTLPTALPSYHWSHLSLLSPGLPMANPRLSTKWQVGLASNVSPGCLILHLILLPLQFVLCSNMMLYLCPSNLNLTSLSWIVIFSVSSVSVESNGVCSLICRPLSLCSVCNHHFMAM